MERILVVDDEPSNLSMVRRMLRKHAVELDMALSGQEALDKIPSFRPDLVILDIMMPGMDGYEVCRRIKENPETAGTMVLLLSARSNLSDRLKGYAENSDDFLAKPFDEEELLARVAILLRLKSAIDQAHQAKQRKADFLATMSHEIRTPMGGMIGMLEILEQTPLSDEQKDCVHSIRSGANALLSLINEILDFSKIEAGKTELTESDFDLLELVDELNDILAVPAAKKGLDYGVIVEGTVPVKLRGDAGRLRQILLNLTGNAIKFTSFGRVCVRVSLDKNQGDGSILAFRVEDSGIGIPEKAIPHLFDSYSQAGKDIAGKFGGTGLGLAISRKLAGLMGGDIRVESVEGRGSAFTVRVSLTRQPPTSLTPSSIRGMRILYADTSGIGRQAMAELCSRWGSDLSLADDAAQVISALNEGREHNRPYRAILCSHTIADAVQTGLQSVPCPGTAFARIASYSNRRGHDCGPGLFRTCLFHPLKAAKLLDWLTRIQDNSLPEVHGVPDAPDQRFPATGLNVLLADDNEISRQVALRMLNKLGCRVSMVTTGKEAISAFEHETFDLIFMDSMMPEMNGLDATRKIREMESRSGSGKKRTPIMALTGSVLKEDQERFFDAGADEFILKPVSLKTFQDILARLNPTS